MIREQNKSIDDLIKLITKQPSRTYIEFICRLNLLLFRTERALRGKLQIEFAEKLLGGIDRTRVMKVLKLVRGTHFTSEKHFLMLMKIALSFPNTSEQQIQNIEEVGETILLSNDFAEPTELSTSREAMIPFILRNIWSNMSDDRGAVARSYQLIALIPPKLNNDPNHIDLAEKFHEIMGISFKRYLAFMFALWANWFTTDANFQEQRPMDIEEFFSKSSATEEEKKIVFSKSLLDFPDYSEAIKKAIPDVSVSQYKNLPFIKYPLITFDKKYCWPISVKFLESKLGHGLYWDLFDGLKPKPSDPSTQFTNFFGKVFERYVIELLESIFPNGESNLRPSGKHSGDGPEIDYLLAEPNSIVHFEIKSSRLNLPTLETGDVTLFDKDLEKTILDAAVQLTISAEALVAGKIPVKQKIEKAAEIWPVIICFAPFPQHDFIWERIRSQLDSRNLLPKSTFKPLTIINVTELESSLAVMADKGMSFLLREKNNDPTTRGTTFNNFIWKKYAGHYKRHSLMEQRFNETADLLKKELFPNEVK